MSATFFSQGPDVGLVVHVGRHDGVLSPVSEGGLQSDNRKFNRGCERKFKSMLNETLDSHLGHVQILATRRRCCSQAVFVTLPEEHSPRSLSSPGSEHPKAARGEQRIHLKSNGTMQNKPAIMWTGHLLFHTACQRSARSFPPKYQDHRGPSHRLYRSENSEMFNGINHS